MSERAHTLYSASAQMQLGKGACLKEHTLCIVVCPDAAR